MTNATHTRLEQANGFYAAVSTLLYTISVAVKPETNDLTIEGNEYVVATFTRDLVRLARVVNADGRL
jgi:hypothetical protein